MITLPIPSQIEQLISLLASQAKQTSIEATLYEAFKAAPDEMASLPNDYYSVLNSQLYRFVIKHYKHGEEDICMWRYIKNLSADQLNIDSLNQPSLRLNDYLIRLYFYSDPLDDLSCIFIPICDNSLIKKYLAWIKRYFYQADYPTSLLWLYALDSSVVNLFPDEIIYLGKRMTHAEEDIMLPDFGYDDGVLIKRYNDQPDGFTMLTHAAANMEFQQLFGYLQQEYKDRCLSRSGKQEEDVDDETYAEEWEKFEDVLKFGVSDRTEKGCISFSDMRSSTEFLNGYGKTVYLSKIQQPFFERTQLISRKYFGRIDKFMGDNVMCVFLNRSANGKTPAARESETILNNLFAIFSLCQVLHELMVEHGFTDSNLGLRSGLTYGDHILRSNLGNEIVRDFTVTGETVNLAARLEHISVQELIIHNQQYFARAIARFPQISDLITLDGSYDNLNAETKGIIQKFTLYQNIYSNFKILAEAKYDIRFNQGFYQKLRHHLLHRGYQLINRDVAETYGCETFLVDGFQLDFYFSYYKPKGFSGFEKMWILPLKPEVLSNLDIETIR